MSSVNLPKGRDLASEYARTLTAQSNIMPSLLAAQAQYQPLQASNQLANMNALLNGTPAGNYETQSFVPAVYKKGSNYSYGKIPEGVMGTIDYPTLPDAKGGGSGGGGGISFLMPPGLTGPGSMGTLPGMPNLGGGGGGMPGISGMFGGGLFGGGKPTKKLVSGSRYVTTNHAMPAQRGLLDIYNQDVLPQMSGGIIPTLTNQANYDLSLGGNMDPAMFRQAMQAVRSRQAGMLGGTGSAGDFQEALGVSAFGNQLMNQRRGFAQNVAAMRMGANPVSQAMGLAGMPGATSLFNPESPYASDIYNTNYNAKVNSAIANANNQNALIGAGISAVGSLGGAAMGAMI